jgi:hypothetical protein
MDAWRARLQASFDFLMEDDDEEDAFNMSLVLGLGFGMEGDLGLSRGLRARSLLQNSPTGAFLRPTTTLKKYCHGRCYGIYAR